MRESIKAKDGKELYIYCWDRVKNPKAMLHIFHGMAEHAGRYKEFSEYLNNHGIIVYASDHRGHGKTAGIIEELGYIGEDGFNAIVEDKHLIFEQMKQSKLLDSLSFGSYNKRIKGDNHKFSWLSTDREEVIKYEEDSFCGSVFTSG